MCDKNSCVMNLGGISAWLLFAMILATLTFLSGCALDKGETSLPKTTDIKDWPSVTRLKDGRKGFIIREKPNGSEEWVADFELAVARMEEENYPKAIELLEKVVAQSPGVTAPYINIAICYARTGKPDQAEKHLKTALELIPGHPAASNEYGMLLRKAGRFAEVQVVYEKALETFPEYLPIRRNLGILCDLYLNDPDCALEHYEIYSKARPEDEKVKMWIADFRLRLGRGE